jgi:hypothetical protein
MAYRIRYQLSIDWLAPGVGPMGAPVTPLQGGQGGSASDQTLNFSNTQPSGLVAFGAGTNGALAAADITNLLAAMSADLSTQLNAAAVLARLGLWPTGGS